MTKRQFIDQVRQYAAIAKQRRVSYASVVQQAHDLYLQACERSGYSEAEMAKERDWAGGVVTREYGKYDDKFVLIGSG